MAGMIWITSGKTALLQFLEPENGQKRQTDLSNRPKHTLLHQDIRAA